MSVFQSASEGLKVPQQLLSIISTCRRIFLCFWKYKDQNIK